jgi:FkbM family methyltransferase
MTLPTTHHGLLFLRWLVYSSHVVSWGGMALPRIPQVNSFFNTRGQSAGVSARLYFNKLVYAFIRGTRGVPPQGWLHSRWYWFWFPLSLRGRVLWSPPLQAWFCPEDETALEYMLRLEDYEPVSWVQPREGEVYVDVGGYAGFYSIAAARAVGPTGRVIVLEPEPNNRRQLERNLALNGIANCQVFPLAAWSLSGSVGWHQDDHPVWHKVEASESARAVDAVSIDDLVRQLSLPRVDWIKMDIEGGEVEALKGTENTLRTFRPQLFVEIHETLTPVTKLLSGFGYSIENATFDLKPERHGWILARAC